jgi:hypothetical protein
MDSKVSIALLVALEGVHAYGCFIPNYAALKFVDDESEAKVIREGEMLAVGYVLLLGMITSQLAKSWLPLIYGGLAAGLMLAVSEYSLRRVPAPEPEVR